MITYVTDPSEIAPLKGTVSDVLNKPFVEDSPEASSDLPTKAPIPKNNFTASSAKNLPENIWMPLPNATGEIAPLRFTER